MGRRDVVPFVNEMSGIPLLLALFAQSAVAGAGDTLLPGRILPLFDGAVEVADLDGDGTQDIVAAARYVGRFDVAFNLGGGVFAPAVEYPVSSRAETVTVEDLNGDGAPDVVFTNSLFTLVSVFLTTVTGTWDRRFST